MNPLNLIYVLNINSSFFKKKSYIKVLTLSHISILYIFSNNYNIKIINIYYFYISYYNTSNILDNNMSL